MESETINFEENGEDIIEFDGEVIETDDIKLNELLESFYLPEVQFYLKKASIDYESLRYLSKEDIQEAIPPIGLRARFREKLFVWRKSEFGCDDDTLSVSVANKVVSWLQSQSNASPSTSTFSVPTLVGGSQLSKKLKLRLQESLKGTAIIRFYEQNGHLTDSFRADLITIILEDVFSNGTKLSPKDFPALVDEILEEFLNEIKEYYFTARRSKKNPGGKLWDKYTNQKAKRIRINRKLELPDPIAETSRTEIDDTIAIALKASLSRDFSNWDEVKDKWQRTFLLRQKELKTSSSNYEFLSSWPLYSNARAHELIKIDFDLLYPEKSHLLHSKWNDYKEKIEKYYSSRINDKKSKEIFGNAKETTDISKLFLHFSIHFPWLNKEVIAILTFNYQVCQTIKESV